MTKIQILMNKNFPFCCNFNPQKRFALFGPCVVPFAHGTMQRDIIGQRAVGNHNACGVDRVEARSGARSVPVNRVRYIAVIALNRGVTPFAKEGGVVATAIKEYDGLLA